MPKINLLYIIPNLAMTSGGAESVVTSLSLGLDKTRYNVAVCSLIGGEGRLADILRAHNVPIFALERSYKLDIRVLFDLVHLMRQQGTHIVHSHLYRAIVYGTLAGKLAGVPIILSTEHHLVDVDASREAILLRQMIAPLLSGITTVSQAVKDSVVERLGIDPERVFPIYNGVKEIAHFSNTSAEFLRQRYNIGSDCLVIGTACRMLPWKDPLTFVEAAYMVLQKGVRAHFLMIGSGPLRPAVESRIADLNITNCFTLIEHTDDIYSVFSLLDVFVLNSWYEGMGLVLLEAMLLSKPTIGTDVAGINEVIVDGQTGLLVPPRNPTALSEAIVSLILEPARREQMGQAGHLRVTSEFSLEKQVLETAALYEKLVQEKRLGDLNTCG